MNKLGIMVEQLDFSQLGISLTESLNRLLATNADIDAIVFYENWAVAPLAPNFSCMMEREVWGLKGTLMSTNLKTAERMLKCPGPNRRLFYVWDLEWLRLPFTQFEKLSSIYCNPNLELVACSPGHADLLTKLWKKPVAVMDNFNPDILKGLIRGI